MYVCIQSEEFSAQRQVLSQWRQVSLSCIFLSAMRSQFLSLHLSCIAASSNVVLGLPAVFFPWSLPSITFFNKESCLLRHARSNFFAMHFLEVTSKERLSSIPSLIFAHSTHAVSRESLFVARSTSQRPLGFLYILSCLNVRVSLMYSSKTTLAILG